jgi:hypothetical protein
VEIVGVEIEAEKEIVGDYREYVVASDAIAVGMVKTEFDDGIDTTRPSERNGDLVENNITRFGYSLDHGSTI